MDVKTCLGLAAGGILGAAVTYSIMSRRVSLGRQYQPLEASILHDAATYASDPPGQAAADAGTKGTGGALLDDDIVGEQLTRNLQFFGREGQERVMNSFVVVVGLGGVGSHTANMLLRSGVSRLRLIDFDQVTLSSLNRHAVAERSDVGTPKALCMKAHFERVFPEATIEAVPCMYDKEAEEALLEGNPDFVVDAIDNIDTKVDLIAACLKRGIPMLVCAGAGAKADPTRIRIADICESSSDPLARAVRTRLRRDHRVHSGVPTLLSTEKQRCALVPCEGDDMSQYQVIPNFRVRTIPVLGAVPAIFGMSAASYVLCHLAQQPFVPDCPLPIKMDQYETLYDRLITRSEENWGGVTEVHVDYEDVVYLVKDLFHGRSARSPPNPGKGLWRSTHNLTLTLWDPQRPAEIDNLVLLTVKEADEHEDKEGGCQTVRVEEPEFAEYVERCFRQARRDHGFTGAKHW